MDERELERLMKEGLERRAATVDESAAGELLVAARAGSPRRPWRNTAVMGLAAASVAGIALAALLLDDDDIRSGGRDAIADPSTGVPVSGWRTEYWHDIQVDVPADWGWGGAPLPDAVPVGETREEGGEGRLLDCGAQAYIAADGERFLNGDPSVPYVGRPVYMTDVCSVVGSSDGKPDSPPTAPYVWLGVRIEPGTVDVGAGYTQETIEVNGSTVTVATKDEALRDQILATAQGGETCMSEYDGAPTIQAVPREGVQDITGMTVCAYAEEGGRAELTYVTHVGPTAVDSFRVALDNSVVAGCRPGNSSEWVLLTVEGADGSRQEHLVHLGECSGIEMIPGGDRYSLTENTVAPWAVDGIPAYVVGPYGGRGLTGGFFKGMLG
jgi:hypothetical protein